MNNNRKVYYDVLDGLRGMAAIVILIFHYMEAVYLNYEDSFIGHGFLAVDFFFCLSGFVIGFAYDSRIKETSNKNFFINRLIRLHPMVIMGSVIGFAGYLADPYVAGLQTAGWPQILLVLLGSLLLIPFPVLPFRGGALFPYNSPAWSLFFEYLVNIFYAFVLCRIKKGALLCFAAVFAGWLVYASVKSGWLINGWDAKTYMDGFPRVLYSFTAGLCVYRFNLAWKNKSGFTLPLILLMGVFLYPHINNDWLTESLLVIFAFPVIISIGAGAVVTGALRRFCIFIGRLSYPLYMSHISSVWIFTNYYSQYHPAGKKLLFIVAIAALCNLSFAYMVMKLYDEPARKWLTGLYKKRTAAVKLSMNLAD